MAYFMETSDPLRGEIHISGSKNAALPLLAATLLTADDCRLCGLPAIHDVCEMRGLLACLGATERVESDGLVLRAQTLQPSGDTRPHIEAMRASVLALGPLLARQGETTLALPGGCSIGLRPIDQHLKGFRAMGAQVRYTEAGVQVRAGRLHGAAICLDIPSVGATENLLLAASLAQGHTRIENAAREPEIGCLAQALNRMGARVQGIDTGTLCIEGVERLHGATLRPIPDRIEAGTYLCMAAATGGDVYARGAEAAHLRAVLDKLREMGARLDVDAGGIRLRGAARKPTELLTLAYPGFPTDLQAPFLALTCLGTGTSMLVETIFESRFAHVASLRSMGAQISVRDRVAVVRGVPRLYGTRVEAHDLRAGAALVLAGLVAEGHTTVQGTRHIERGYEAMAAKLSALGARIREDKPHEAKKVGVEINAKAP